MGRISPAAIILLVLRLRLVMCYSDIPVQYHIQTDKGPNRYFTYQTYNGQYRKEKRLQDGSVVGTYGWVDPTGLLRLLDYYADENGYQIVGEKERRTQVQPAPANRLPINPIKLPTSKRRKPFLSIPATGHVDIAREPSTSSATTQEITPASASVPTSVTTTPKPKPKLRPLFVSKKRKNSQGQFGSTSRRRQNFVSARKRLRQQNQHQQPEYKQPQQQPQKPQQQQQNQHQQPEYKQPQQQLNDVADRRSTVRRNRIRTKTIVRPLSQSTRTPSAAPRGKQRNSISDFGYDDPGGKVTMDYDLGNQYRREKIFPDGTVVGEHGYVDPFGILRRTTYTSGANGLIEAKQSYWIGVRMPGHR